MKIQKLFAPAAMGILLFQTLINIANAQQSPTILTQPQSTNVYETQRAEFTVSASGPSLSYQWYYNGVEIDYATNTSYVITLVRPINAGTYSVVVSNPYGSIQSQGATLTVTPIPNCQQAIQTGLLFYPPVIVLW